MISHADCDHPSTSSARAACRRRRARAGGETTTSNSSPASVKTKWGGKSHHDPDRERNTGQVPRDREAECHSCHVERILARGTDPITGILLFVGERCMWKVENQPDFQVLP